MRDIKILILNEQHAEQVQELLFELGYQWSCKPSKKNKVMHTKCAWYQTDTQPSGICYISEFWDNESFKSSPKKEADLEYLQELVSINRGYGKVKQQAKQHPHRDIINAMLEDTDLLVLRRCPGTWIASNLSRVAQDKDRCFDFFLCHKNNMGICLHWLNGGAIECQSSNGEWLYIAPPTNDEISILMTHSLMTKANEKLRISKVKKYSVISKIPTMTAPMIMQSKEFTRKDEADQLAKTMQEMFPNYEHRSLLLEEI